MNNGQDEEQAKKTLLVTSLITKVLLLSYHNSLARFFSKVPLTFLQFLHFFLMRFDLFLYGKRVKFKFCKRKFSNFKNYAKANYLTRKSQK